MAVITKAQAVTLLAQEFDDQRQNGETDLQLVQRIRAERLARAKDLIDSRLKEIVIARYYENNPTEQETVEDLN